MRAPKQTMPTDNSEIFLSLKGLHKSYQGVVAIDHISLDIERGEFMTFLGPSGSGKSTTLDITAGFEDPTEGRVLLQGHDLLNVRAAQRNIGMVFQRYTLFPHLSVAENIAFPLRVRHWSKEAIHKRVQAMLALVQLQDLGLRKPASLSGGQQQRVAIARALAYDPPILLMDEPLSALDKKLREEMQNELKRIHKQTGVTILYVTHDQDEALRLSDRIAVFNQGRIDQVGTGPELYARPKTKFVAGFIGNSNFVDAHIECPTSSAPIARLPDGTALACGHFSDAPSHSEKVQLMFRPDALRLDIAAGQKLAKGTPVDIIDRSFLGESIQFSVATPWGQHLEVRMSHADAGANNWMPGDQAMLVWDERHSVCFAAFTI